MRGFADCVRRNPEIEIRSSKLENRNSKIEIRKSQITNHQCPDGPLKVRWLPAPGIWYKALFALSWNGEFHLA